MEVLNRMLLRTKAHGMNGLEGGCQLQLRGACISQPQHQQPHDVENCILGGHGETLEMLMYYTKWSFLSYLEWPKFSH
jgi:hypothetical protein